MSKGMPPPQIKNEREKKMKTICPYENAKCTRKIKGYCCADKNFECTPKKKENENKRGR
jgi:hypothetical protein